MNIILHIGQPKTGTTSIQKFLYHNREVLESFGYYYETYYDESNKEQFKYSFNHVNIHNFSLQQIKTYFDTMLQDAKKKNLHTIIISSEMLWAINEQFLTLLQHLFPNTTITAIVYLKRPDLSIESLWQQWYFFKYQNFEEYYAFHPKPDNYTRLKKWQKYVDHLIVKL
ncbi:MAG: hypothetical protein JXQ76_08170, partial [Campylobacterales bacterium]|nr:hypothetical protein [Campylobacterales bacterium]